MKIQRPFASILSSILIAGMAFTLPAQAMQSGQQPSNQQDQSQQNPTSQPTQTNQVPANTEPAPPAQDQSTAPANSNQASPAQQQPTTPRNSVNPSQAPLQPVTTYPDAAGEQQAQPQQTTAPAQNNIPSAPQPKKQSEPVGAATAESVPTSGGAAAKPAGVAIAPAKQHQTRSLLIKVGAALAAGAAVGTIFALTHGTSSTPPGATLPGVTQK